MQKPMILVICLAFAGSPVVGEASGTAEKAAAPSALSIPTGMSRRFISLRQVHAGMTRNEVKGVLSQNVIVGYEMGNPNDKHYKPIVLSNPYRNEVVKKGTKKYSVDYYLVGIKNPDDQVTDDELIPLVYENDKLVGQGWDFFHKQIKN